jgi:hypothetical protein
MSVFSAAGKQLKGGYMLRNLSELRRYVIEARDGEIGRCHDFLFDDRYWAIRYMVADTRKWLPGRKVLISPISLESPDWQGKRFPVKLTREQVKGSPPLEEDQPVSRQYEGRFFDYYNWPYYWIGPYPWGTHVAPLELYAEKLKQGARDEVMEHHDSHLRSMKEVKGYHIQAIDGEIGHVEDFLADEKAWTIRYLVVDTRNWLPGRKVLIASDWLDSVSWSHRTVSVVLNREQIKDSPEYNPSVAVERSYERLVYNYYGIPPYWHKKIEEDMASK